MKNNNYKDTHIRIFDKSGLIFSASPDIDAYNLSRIVLDMIQDQTKPKYNTTYADALIAKHVDPNGKELPYITVMREECRGIFEMSLERSLYTILTNGEAVNHSRLDDLTDRFTSCFCESFVTKHLSIFEPVPCDHSQIEVAFDILEIKTTLLALGLSHYYPIKESDFGSTEWNIDGSPRTDKDNLDYVNYLMFSTFDRDKYHDVAAIMVSDVIHEGTDWCSPEDWETDRYIRIYREMRDVIDNIDQIIVYNPDELKFIFDTTEDADTDVIEAKQCLECRSMNTIDAGSGAGCCNACGAWIPDYEFAKRLTGE